MKVQLKLASKISLTVGAIVLAMVVYGVVMIFTVIDLKQTITLLNEKKIKPLGIVVELAADRQAMKVALRDILLANNPDELNQAINTISKLKKNMAANNDLYSKASEIDEEDVQLYNQWDEDLKTYYQQIDVYIDHIRNVNITEAQLDLKNIASGINIKLTDDINAIKEMNTRDTEKVATQAANKTQKTIWITLGFMLGLVTFSLIAVLALKTNIKAILDSFSEEMKRLLKAILIGHLETRAQTENINFEFRPIAEGINQLVKSVTSYLDHTAPIAIMDTELNIIYANKTAIDVIGKPKNSILGTKCYDNFKAGDCKSDRCAVSNCMKTGKKQTSETDAHPGQHHLQISYDGIPLLDDADKIVGAVEVITDLTAIKQSINIAEKIAI